MKILKTKLSFLITALSVFFFSSINLVAQPRCDTPERVVDELYDLVTFKSGTTPDWEKVKELFLDEAVIVLRTSRTENKIFNLDDFVGDFKRFIKESNITETGFSETILKKYGNVFGDIAWYMVLYEAKIPETERKNLGVDHFSLVKTSGQWKIVSITNEIPTNERPVPIELTN
ncbi:nuclear transport factor 2 family protein [Draconibacterium sp.]|nr:nuclear transport factor 2 family protein [Draconibacterium sp.]